MFSNDLIRKRILVVGSNGMLGQHLIKFYSSNENISLLGCSIEDKPFSGNYDYVQCDISRRDEVKKILYDFYPDIIINAAGFTNVDLCERERETAWKVNVKAVEYIAEVANIIDAQIFQISTDYIFDGKNGPFSETSTPNPLNYYGRTKLASENALKTYAALSTIIRTNVLYGSGSNCRPDFVRWTIETLRRGEKIKIVSDQFNNPTFIDDLVEAINKLIEFKKTGVYNVGGKELLSRYDFSLLIAEYFNLDKELIIPVLTKELNQTAKRPLNSGLITIKAETEIAFKPRSIIESFQLIKKENSL
ncbi:MAG: dTDP-4-dehydrorhamnose reductase [Ignavibacteriaceae bacterium]|nr:dTDP-4-dehydrorhamnose reductase [Ignavibacteriaceae bacterium]